MKDLTSFNNALNLLINPVKGDRMVELFSCMRGLYSLAASVPDAYFSEYLRLREVGYNDQRQPEDVTTAESQQLALQPFISLRGKLDEVQSKFNDLFNDCFGDVIFTDQIKEYILEHYFPGVSQFREVLDDYCEA